MLQILLLSIRILCAICITLATSTSAQPLQLKNLYDYADTCTDIQKTNNEFCSCVAWGADQKGGLPKPQTLIDNNALFLSKGYTSNKLKNQWFLQACEIYAPINLNTSLPKNTPLAQKILKQHKNKVFTPEMVNHVQPIKKPIGWKYTYRFNIAEEKNIDFNSTTYTYAGKQALGEAFTYMNAMGKLSSRMYILNSKGQLGFVKSKTVAVAEEEQCKFVLGSCTYREKHKIKQKFTQFIDGVWISNNALFSLKRRQLQKVIYDTSGIPLYRSSQQSGSEHIKETIRYDAMP